MNYQPKTFKWGVKISDALKEVSANRRKKMIVIVLEALADYDPILKKAITEERGWDK